MKLHSIKNGDFPPEKKYVLIYCEKSPWEDGTDNKGVFWKVAKMVGNYEYRSNKVPHLYYFFEEFGPTTWDMQDIDIWCELPKV